MTMAPLEKAQLRELDETLENEINNSQVTVQFNPETLKVSYANTLDKPEGGGDQRGAAPQLFVGSGTTKLTCQLWFDVSAPQPTDKNQPSAVDDVRKLTNRVSFFITPREKSKNKFVPPGVRFLWGSFQFDGVMEGIEESLEFFSPDGKPLRASVSITMTQQKILVFPPIPPGGKPTPGSKLVPQLTKSVQQTNGKGWQAAAQRNGIENPRRPPPGQRLA